MFDGATMCALFVLCAGAYLTAGYWAKTFEKRVPWRPLRCALGFATVHTIFILILVWDGEILVQDSMAWQDWTAMVADLPVGMLVAFFSSEHHVPLTPLVRVLLSLSLGGLQWFVLGLLYAAASQRLTGASGLNRVTSG